MKISLLFFFLFPHTYLKNSMVYTNNLHTKWLLYYQRFSFSGFELHARQDWQVMAPNTHHSLFRYAILCILTCITKKLQAIYMYGRSAYWMTVLLSKMSIFCIRAASEIWLASYGSKHTSQSLFNMPFVHTYMHNLKTTGCIWTIYIIKWLLYYLRHYVTGELQPQTGITVVLWYNIVCILQALHTSLFCGQLHITTKRT